MYSFFRFANGITFTDRPLVPEEHVVLRWSSAAESRGFEAYPSVGLSSRDPDSMRPEDLPSSTCGWEGAAGIWTHTIESAFGGEVLELWLTDDGSVSVPTSNLNHLLNKELSLFTTAFSRVL